MARGGSYAQGSGAEVPIKEFAPDRPPDEPGILLDIIGGVPTMKGFRTRPSTTQFGSALAATYNGSTVAYYSDETSSLVAGNLTNLYRYSAGAPSSIGSGYAPTTRWRFFQFGDDLIAVANGVAPQVANGNGGTFGALGGSPPANATLGCSAGGTAFLFRGASWFSSASGVDNDWVASVQTLAATGTLYDYPGSIVACAPFYRTVIAWKKGAMWLGSFVGPPFSYSWQLISVDTGTWSQECVVLLPDAIAFLGTDDFYYTTGSIPYRIPNNLKEWFFTNVNRTYLGNTYGWYDENNAIINWAFVSLNAPAGGNPDQVISYNRRANRWGRDHLSLLGVPWPNTSPVISSPIYFDLNNVAQQLNGTPGPMTLLTGYMGDPNRLTQLFRVRPKYNLGQGNNGPFYPTTENVAAFYTNVLGKVPLLGPTPVRSGDGWFNVRQTGRYHQVSLATAGDTEVIAFAFERRAAGVR